MRKPKAKTDQGRKPRKQQRREPIKPGQRLLTKPQVLELLGNPSYTTLWGWMCDGHFPRALELGPAAGRSSMIAWDANEVFGWLATRPRRQLGNGGHEFRGTPRAPEDEPPSAKPSAKRRTAEAAR